MRLSDKSHYTTPPNLKLWVKSLEFYPGVFGGGELPIDAFFGDIPTPEPRDVSMSHIRRFKHCFVNILNSISAASSQLPCFGVW